jgi:hypothetical protein
VAITDAAQQNHDELFPGHVSALKVSDPELIEYFDKLRVRRGAPHVNLDTPIVPEELWGDANSCARCRSPTCAVPYDPFPLRNTWPPARST